jgi:hypothetical protein
MFESVFNATSGSTRAARRDLTAAALDRPESDV